MTEPSSAANAQNAAEVESIDVQMAKEAKTRSTCILELRTADGDHTFSMPRPDLILTLRNLLRQIDPTPEQQIVDLLKQNQADESSRRAAASKAADAARQYGQKQNR